MGDAAGERSIRRGSPKKAMNQGSIGTSYSLCCDAESMSFGLVLL